jgi:hypothetical protein
VYNSARRQRCLTAANKHVGPLNPDLSSPLLAVECRRSAVKQQFLAVLGVADPNDCGLPIRERSYTEYL